MNYKKHYDLLIEKAQARVKPDCYFEKHHIVPRCAGGSDKKSNLVNLTAREHYVAHVLLAKAFGGAHWFAVMSFKNRVDYDVNSRTYEVSKHEASKLLKKMFTGKKLSDEHKSKISLGIIGNTNTLGRKLSEEHKTKIVESLMGNQRTLGKVASDETRAKMSKSHSGEKHHYFGVARSQEVKDKIRATLKARNSLLRLNPQP